MSDSKVLWLTSVSFCFNPCELRWLNYAVVFLTHPPQSSLLPTEQGHILNRDLETSLVVFLFFFFYVHTYQYWSKTCWLFCPSILLPFYIHYTSVSIYVCENEHPCFLNDFCKDYNHYKENIPHSLYKITPYTVYFQCLYNGCTPL